MDKEEN